MKIVLFFCLLIFSFYSFADNSYYPQSFTQSLSAIGANNHEIKKIVQDVLTKLHLKENGKPDLLVDECKPNQICTKRKILSYEKAREYLFGKLHLKKNENGYYIKDVYCNKIYNNDTDDIGNIGPMQIPNHVILNVEHTWPKSRFANQCYEAQESDLHHLFPSQMEANSTRSSYQFGEVSTPMTNELCETSNFGLYLGHPDKSIENLFFTPPAEHRGNVARALFYFSTKYDLKISSDEEYYLRKWHIADPIDDEEIQRNNDIYEIQFNRNPYIDYPFLVELINDF